MDKRFIIAFLGFIFGAIFMAIVYDLRMAHFDMGFTTPSGLPPNQAIIVKIGFAIICLIGLIMIVIKGPQNQMEIENEGIKTK
jgi:hypothetical protein